MNFPTLVITAYKEPNIVKAVEAALNQETNRKYHVLVSAPDDETLNKIKDYPLYVYKDKGQGKSCALNDIFAQIDSDILILTDGDVVISDNAVEEILKMFEDPRVGCVTGCPVPMEDRDTKYGYWANFLFDAAHDLRKKAYAAGKFIECSGYLFAFRRNVLNKIPLDVSEDAVIPYYFWEKGYKIGYAEQAQVFVKNVDNLKDWIKQKVRTSKAHSKLGRYVDTKKTKRVKSFGTEAKGIISLAMYPESIKETWWSVQLVFARLYMWIKVALGKKDFGDAWERIESTK